MSAVTVQLLRQCLQFQQTALAEAEQRLETARQQAAPAKRLARLQRVTAYKRRECDRTTSQLAEAVALLPESGEPLALEEAG